MVTGRAGHTMSAETFLLILASVVIIALIFSVHESYKHGVWDATHNPTIPPVKHALENLHKRGWR